MRAALLGVNIDHVATLREARGTSYPDVIEAMQMVEKAGADGITVHPREDKRHIQFEDAILIKKMHSTRLNLEMAVIPAMLDLAERISPKYACFVPEKREELTTEGGLDVIARESLIKDSCSRLTNNGTGVSLFIDPDIRQIDAAKRVGAGLIEIHTGAYAEAKNQQLINIEYQKIADAAKYADSLGLVVNAGHGLHYTNTAKIAAIPEIYELNIGHAIIARAVFVGLYEAVYEMKQILQDARK